MKKIKEKVNAAIAIIGNEILSGRTQSIRALSCRMLMGLDLFSGQNSITQSG